MVLSSNYTATFDYTGAVDYLDVFNESVDAYTELTIVGGKVMVRLSYH